MLGSCRLNNKSMRNVRRNEVYQAIAIDLAMLGVISKEECEMLLGSGIPSGIVLPNGKPGELVSEAALPEQPAFIQTEPEQTTVPDAEPEGPETMGEETEPTGQEPEVVNGAEGEIVADNGEVSPVEQPVPEPIPGVTVMPGDEQAEPAAEVIEPEVTNDEGRSESDN